MIWAIIDYVCLDHVSGSRFSFIVIVLTEIRETIICENLKSHPRIFSFQQYPALDMLL